MKTIIAILFTAFLSLSFAQSEKTLIDLTASTAEWTGKKLTGEHTGNITISKAKLNFNGEKLIGGSFTLDMQSITCTDLGKTMADKLEGHLKSEDFFSVKEFPESTLEFVNVKHIEGNSYLIVADLTIKGIRLPIEFPAKVEAHTASATLLVDRAKYHVRYGSTSFFDNIGDKAINDIFEVKVNLVY